MDRAPQRLRLFAWGFFAYTVAVILWGAYVRATGSGAGCGDHWPLCNGEVVPRVGTTETLVELTHRVTSGLAWLGAFVLMVWTRRAAAPRSPLRRAGGWVLFFMTTEALVGAAIVLLEKVADDASLARGGWMAAHLINTFLLLGALTQTVRAVEGRAPLSLRPRGTSGLLVVASLLGVLVLGTSGAITALGDTLFPASSLAEGVRAHFSQTSHVLQQLSVLHPVLGITVGALVLGFAGHAASSHRSPAVRRSAIVVASVFVLQVGLGFLNIALLAPVWMQLVHLLVADLLWVSLLWLAAEATRVEATADESAERASAVA